MNKEEELFVFDETKTKKLVKKAKMISLLKIAGLTIVITPIILIVVMYSLSQVSMNTGLNLQYDIEVFNDITTLMYMLVIKPMIQAFSAGKLKLKPIK